MRSEYAPLESPLKIKKRMSLLIQGSLMIDVHEDEWKCGWKCGCGKCMDWPLLENSFRKSNAIHVIK
jgi:hypothetical protein